MACPKMEGRFSISRPTLAVLLILACVIALVSCGHLAVSVWKTRATVCAVDDFSRAADLTRAVDKLGGAEQALRRIDFYLKLPNWIAPNKNLAARILGVCGDDAVPVLLRTLEHEKNDVRAEAAVVLGRLAPGDATVADALVAALDDTDAGVRLASIEALGAFAANPTRVVPALMKSLQTQEFRAAAMGSLGELGPAASPAVPDLIGVLGEEPEGQYAAHALGSIGSGAVPHLLRALRSSKKKVRENAAHALILMGPAAKEAAPALLGLLGDPDVGAYAATALSRFGSGVVPDLLKVLRTAPDPDARACAAIALGQLGANAAEAVPQLTAALADPYAQVRVEAAKALGKMGLAAQEAVSALVNAQDDRQRSVRSAANRALLLIRTDGRR